MCNVSLPVCYSLIQCLCFQMCLSQPSDLWWWRLKRGFCQHWLYFVCFCNSGLNLGTYGLTLLYCWSWCPHFNPALQLPVCRWTMISCGRTSRRSSRCQWHVPMVHKPSSTSTLGLWSFLFMIAVVNVADINNDIRILLCDDVPWCRFNTRIWSWPEKLK